MQPYPLVDPAQLVSVLPNLPERNISAPTDPVYYDKFGYLKGERGIRIAVTEWTKRRVSQGDPSNLDLGIVITATPSPEIASEAFALGLLQDKKLDKPSAKFEALEIPASIEADQIDLRRLQVEGTPTMYMINARYGNYVFRFIGLIVAGGYFENEQQFFERMQTLSAHVRATLERHAVQPGAPGDWPRQS
jgi:hypothetical protein